MDEINVKELSKFRFQKALIDIESTKNLFKLNDYGTAQNRTYYSLFDAIRAVNALDGFDSSKHSGVIAHFNQEYVKTKIFPPETSIIIKKISTLREKSDYEDFYKPNRKDTSEGINNVEIFLKNVENYLKTKSVI